MLDLTPDQRAVVNDRLGARSVVAGPGSGKSTVLVEMIRSLIQSGVPASEVRGITFSKEMAKALEKKLGIKGVVSTFHSLGYTICSETERKPVEPEIRFRLMCKLIKKFGLDYKELEAFISKMREANISPAQAVECNEYDYGLASAYSIYENTRRQEGWMDFDAMLCDSVEALEKNPRCRDRWSPRYIVVDESQDTSDIQWRAMQLMSQKHGNITVVGDAGQCIYSFRGAKPDNITTKFTEWFPEGRKFYLGKNFRSTKNIVAFVRENAPEDTPKELLDRMVAARDEEGSRIGLKMYWTDDMEAEAALALAQKDPLNSIILARTNRAVGLLERICTRHNIRYHLLGKSGFWKQNEIRKAIDAIKVYPTSTAEAAFNLALPALESKYSVEDRTERDNDALENLKVLRLIGKGYRTAKEFVVYANKMIHRRNDPRGVSISTVHQAKGLEKKNVFIVGANAKGFPHPKGEPREERRIWFVAISRAIDNLRISFAGTPSPYLRRYLTDEILDKMREHAGEVEKIQEQAKLFAQEQKMSRAILYINSKGFEVTRHSFSGGDSFNFCPRKYQLERIMGWTEKQEGAAKFFGIALEKAITFWHQRRKDTAGAVAEFVRLWAEHKDKPYTYAKTDVDWDRLNLTGQELVRLYAIKYPKFPYTVDNPLDFQVETNFEVFPGTKLAGIEFTSYIDLVATTKDTNRPVIIDIKTAGKSIPEFISLDPQLRSYSWVKGWPDVAFLWFRKMGRSVSSGDTVTVLDPYADYAPGDTATVLMVDDFGLWLTRERKIYEDMAEKFVGKSKAVEAARAEYIKANSKNVPERFVTKQRIQYGSAIIAKESAEDIGRKNKRDVANIVRANETDDWTQNSGVRYPNDRCTSCMMRGICADRPDLRDMLLTRKQMDELEFSSEEE